MIMKDNMLRTKRNTELKTNAKKRFLKNKSQLKRRQGNLIVKILLLYAIFFFFF